jgi:hypothetical protein
MAFADAQSNCEILESAGEATIELSGTVTKGDILGYSSGWQRALATAGGVIQGRCVASSDGVSGQRIPVYFDYILLGGTRFSGATVGGAVYVAEGTSTGMYTQTAPTTTADANKIIGYAISPTVLMITPAYKDDSVA